MGCTVQVSKCNLKLYYITSTIIPSLVLSSPCACGKRGVVVGGMGSLTAGGAGKERGAAMRRRDRWTQHTTDQQLFPLLFVGMLMFFTVFVKGIPIITLINAKIGGDKFDPSGDAIIVEGTLFVIRSCVKFLVMNVGCALSDHLGRKPITLFFILPNVCMDLMLLFADINRPVIFTIGALWGLTAITIPTLRAWVCDLCANDSIEMVNAQGSFRGLTIGPATLLGIPLGTAFALYSNPKYAFLLSLAANLLALVIISRTTLDDTQGITRRIDNQQQRSVRIQLTKQNVDEKSVPSGESQDDCSPLHTSPEASASTSVSVDSNSSAPISIRSFPSEGMYQFCLTHAPWSGYEAILELFAQDRATGYLWLIYFLTFCANEVRCPLLPLSSPRSLLPHQTYIHTLFNYLMVGGGMSPLQAACAFALAGISYSVSTEHMLRIVGSVRGNLIGMMISIAMSPHPAPSS